MNVSSTSITASSSSSLLSSSVAVSSASHSSKSHGSDLEDLNMPDAAACVSDGELRDADGLLVPREFLAIRIWEGFEAITVVSTRNASRYINDSFSRTMVEERRPPQQLRGHTVLSTAAFGGK